MKITIREIAKEAGVSAMTVSNVLNKRHKKVSDKTAKKVLEIVEKYNFSLNQNARVLKGTDSNLIGVLYYNKNIKTRFSNPFVAELLDGIEATAKASGYFTIVHSIDNENELTILQKNWTFSGFIVIGVPTYDFEIIDALLHSPTVFIDTVLTDEQLKTSCEDRKRFFIHTKEQGISEMAIDYLVELGHSNIGFLSYPFEEDVLSVFQQRHLGYLKGIEKHNLSYTRIFISTDEEENIQKSGISALIDDDVLTALYVSSDLLAAKLIKLMHEKDKKHLSIIGTDDILMSNFLNPTLTTIKINHFEKGQMSVKMITKLRKNEDKSSEISYVDGKLILRDSTFPLKKLPH